MAEKLQPDPAPAAGIGVVVGVKPQLWVPALKVMPTGQLCAATGSLGVGRVVFCACAATGIIAKAKIIARMSFSSG